MAIRAGRKDRVIVVLRAAAVDDGFAQRPGEPVAIARLLAERADLSDGERLRGGIDVAERLVRFRVRASRAARGIRPSDQVRCDGVLHDLVGIKETEGRHGLELTARAKVAG